MVQKVNFNNLTGDTLTVGNTVITGTGVTVGGSALGAGGATVYANASVLPTSGLTAGDFAYTGNAIFITNGSGWYRVAVTNQDPSLSITQDSISFTGNTNAVLDFNYTVSDPDGTTPTITLSNSGFANTSVASIEHFTGNNTVRITNYSNTTYTGSITLTASDGISTGFDSANAIFTATVVITYVPWDVTVLSVGTSGYAYNLSGAVDTGTNISLSSTQEHFSSDGLTLITVNSSTQVGSHDLSTAYDMSTITASQAYNISEETSVEDARFSSDGTKMYVVGITNDTVYQYSLSTAFDVSSASYDSVSFAINGQESAPRALAFSSDGTKMYISGNSGDDINEYDLSTAWDLSTASYSQVFSLATYQQTPLNIEFSSDGTKLFIYGNSADGSHPEATSGNRIIDRWDLSTAWDVSTMTYHSYLDDPIGANAFGMTFNNDGTTLYVSTTTVVNVFDMSVNNNSNFVDRSTNAHSPTVTGTGMRQTAFHPYLDYWSVEFDGSGDYLSVNSTTAIGSGDYTMELWINGSDVETGTWQSLLSRDYANSDGFRLYKKTGVSELAFYSGGDAVRATTVSAGLTNNTWHHIAVVRNSGTLDIYVDGVSKVSVSNSDNISEAVAPINIGGNTGEISSYPFTGYISNARIVVGSAVYTSSFTPSTENLTAVSGTEILCCNSNRFIDENNTITVGGDPKVSAHNPFGQGSEYDVDANKGACVFDATGNYIDYASDTSFAFGTDDYTVEWWHWQTAQQWGTVFDTSDGSNYINTLFISTSGSANETIKAYHSGGARATGTNGGAFPLYQWTHCAVTRQSGVVKIYINGKLDGQGSGNEDLTQYGATVGRATFWGNSYGLRNGSIVSDLKVTKGTAVYTTSASVGTQVFTPPTSPAGSSSASLYLPFDNAGIFDKTGNHTLTLVNDTSTSTTQTKFADTSMYFDGTGDYITTQLFTLGTGDFTVEGWVYFSDLSANRSLFSLGNNRQFYYRNASNRIAVYGVSGGTQVFNDALPSTSTWYHFAFTRTGSTITLWWNGVSAGTATATDDLSSLMTIGAYAGGSTDPMFGYIENLQVLNTVKYTTTFTPPTAEQGRTYQAES